MNRSARRNPWLNEKCFYYLLFFVVLSLCLKLLVAGMIVSEHPRRSLGNDSVPYLNSAQALLLDGRFGVSPDLSGVPQTLLVPGYPAFLLLVSPYAPPRVHWVVVAQGFTSALTIFLVFWIGTHCVSPAVGFASALLLVVDPNSFGISFFVLSETLFTFFLTLTVLLLLLSRESRHAWIFSVCAGLILGAATLTRPIVLYISPLIILWFVVVARRQAVPLKEMAGNAIVFLLSVLVVVGGWSLRNHSVSGSWSLSQIEGINLLFFRAADVKANVEKTSLHEARWELAGGRDYGELRGIATLDPSLRLGDRWRRQAAEIILEHPVVYAKRALLYMVYLLAGPGDGWIARVVFAAKGREGPLGDLMRLSFRDWASKWVFGRTGEGFVFLFSVFYLVMIYFSVAMALPRMVTLSREHGFWLLIGVVTGYLLIVSAGPEAYYRFRVPMAPFLCLIAGGGLTSLLERFSNRRQGTISQDPTSAAPAGT